MQLGPFNFNPPLLAVLATVLVASLFAGLGRWQLERMNEKIEIINQQLACTSIPALSNLPDSNNDFSSLRFCRVHLSGKWRGDKQFLLDNQVLNGQVGFNVLTPFVLTDERVVLVDRGWVALGHSRQILPDVSMQPDSDYIQGAIYVPFGEPYALGEATAGSIGWPRIIQYLDFPALSAVFGETLVPLVIRMDAQQAGGYQREWQLVPFTAEKHLGYAIQWFALALGTLVLFLVLNLKRKK